MRSVIHLVSGDETEQETAIAIAENLLDDETGTIDEVAVVAQAGGITAIGAGGEYQGRVASLQEDGVSFKACHNTLETKDMDESDLVDGIETVPEGAVEVTRLENEGCSYIRP